MSADQHHSITLVHARSTPISEGLTATFEEIGENVRSVALDSWLEEEPNGRCALLVEEVRNRAVRERIRQRLRQRNFPVLGIFCNQRELPPEIAHLCTDFLVWPCSPGELDVRARNLNPGPSPPMAESVAEESQVQAMLDTGMVGRSDAFRRIQADIRKMAACDAHVLIEGETGTGKELAAHAIHYLSERKGRPFIPVNCGALPENLFENELFGHQSGAYTDARKAQQGLVRQAEGGTLFLDEVDSLAPRAQVVLLRFLQDLRYRPLGAETSRKADIRVVTASNRSLSELVSSGHYRQDLYFRLNIMHLEIPPLRDRPDDIDVLAEHFLSGLRARHDRPEKYLPDPALDWLRTRDWPGNARELENIITREFFMAEGPEINLESIRAPIESRATDRTDQSLDFSTAKSKAIDTFEKRYLSGVLRRAGGNVSMAARLAGKERRAFGKLMRKHGLDRNQFSGPRG